MSKKKCVTEHITDKATDGRINIIDEDSGCLMTSTFLQG